MKFYSNNSNNSDKKFRILFYHCNQGTGHWILPTMLYLKTHIDVYHPGLADNISWTLPIQDHVCDDEFLKILDEVSPDIICTSHYSLNNQQLDEQMSRIKDKINPNIKFIAGGPEINVVLDDNFFTKYPWMDYAVYGPGEEAFSDILNSIINHQPLEKSRTSNCAWLENNNKILADYKIIKIGATSPYLHNKEMFIDMVIDRFSRSESFWLSYALTRGCPYSCTFCDWNNGLSNKVSRRKNTYNQEIDLFQSLGIKDLFLSDANVGQYSEDIDMMEYLAKKNIEENAEFRVGLSVSKLNHNANLKIYHILAKSGLVKKTLNFSIQDINETVLKNIDRPNAGWESYCRLMDELLIAYPHLIHKVQIIYGLPGQTVSSWRNTLKVLTQRNIFPLIFLNEPLPNSPALNDPEYQNKFQYEYIYSEKYVGQLLFNSMVTKQCISFDANDIILMTIMSIIYVALSHINIILTNHQNEKLEIEYLVDILLESKNVQQLRNNLFNNWIMNNKFYFTINFNGTKDLLTPCPMEGGLNLPQDIKFIKYLSPFLSADQSRTLIQLLVSGTLHKEIMEIAEELD